MSFLSSIKSILFAAILAVALAAAPLASAASFATDYSTVRMTSCTRGTIYAYADNDDAVPASIGISANYGRMLFGSVDTPLQQLPAYQSRGTRINFYSNQCFKGDEDVTIYYQLCRDAACTTYTRTVRVIVEPCTGCQSYIEQYLPTAPNYEAASAACVGSGCGSPLVSENYAENDYMPSDYEVALEVPAENYKAVSGSTLEVDATARNLGETATVDFALDGFDSELGARLGTAYAGLSAGETTTIPIYFDIPSDRTGKYCVALTASRKGHELDRRNICVSVYDGVQALISVPYEVSAACNGTANYTIWIENAGAAANEFTITTSQKGATPAQARMYLEAGDKAATSIILAPATLGSGETAVTVFVSGERTNEIDGKRFSGNYTTKVSVAKCLQQTTVEAAPLLSVFEMVYNPSQATLYGVSATIEGLPAEYTVMQKEPNGVDIAPQATANLTVYVQVPADAAGASGMLVIKDNSGKIISQRPVTVNALAKDKGITGFVSSGLGSGFLGIAALLLILAAALYAYSRNFGARKKAAETAQAKPSEKQGNGETAVAQPETAITPARTVPQIDLPKTA